MVKTSRDWVSTVLDELGWDKSFEEIKIMKIIIFMNTIKRKIEFKPLNDFNDIKNNHSKVKHFKHFVLKIHKYLAPNNAKMKQEDAQLIFKLRYHVTEIKINMQGMYDTYECEVCISSSINGKLIRFGWWWTENLLCIVQFPPF